MKSKSRKYLSCLALVNGVFLCLLLLVVTFANEKVVLFRFLLFSAELLFVVGLFSLLVLIAASASNGWVVIGLAVSFLIFWVGNDFFLKDGYSKSELKVMTFNVYSRNSNYAEIAEMINYSDLDVIFLQEVADVDEFLKEVNPDKFFVAASSAAHKITLSKYPINEVSELGNSLVSRVDSGVLVNVHVKKMISSTRQNYHSIQKIKESLITESCVLLAGDFNLTLFNDGYKSLEQVLGSAYSDLPYIDTMTFPASGRRMGMLFPFVRIDHIFYRGMKVRGYLVGEDSFGSDHYPVYSGFSSACLGGG